MGELYGAQSTYGWRLWLGYTIQQSRTNNRSTIALSLQIYDGTGESYNQAANSCFYVLQGSKVYHPYSYKAKGWYDLGTKTITVDHDSKGEASVTLSAEWHSGFTSQWTPASLSVSGKVTLPTIPRASSLAVPALTLGSSATLDVTKADSSYTHKITYAWGTHSGTVTDRTGDTSIAWTPPMELASDIPNAASGVGTLTITTYDGDSVLGSLSYSFTASVPSSAAPVVTVALSDAGGYADTYGAYVQAKSRLRAVTTASGQYGATVKGCALAVSGLTASGLTATSGVLPESGTVGYTVTVTDSRGLVTVLRGTITVLPYAAPGIRSISVARCDADGADDPAGAYALVSFVGAVSPLGDQNTAAYAIRYRPQGADTWSSQAVPAASGQYAPSASGVIPAAVDTVYEVCVAVTDAMGRTDSLIVVLPSAQVLFRTAPAVDGLSIGQYLTEAATLIVGGLIKHLKLPGPAAVLFGGKPLLDYLHPVGSIYQSTDPTSPADLFGGTWEQIKDRFLLAAGDSHEAGTTGGEEEHILTAEEMANHTHGYDYTGQSDATGTGAIKIVSPGSTANAYTGKATSNCGGQAHNNMPPYLAVYTWRRTA
jgi:hypothetical protein